MSAGNLFGLVFNLFAFAAFWTFLGWLVDKLADIFNSTIQVLPTLQDAVTGFAITQVIWGVLGGIAFLAFILNYYLNEHSQSSQEV
jgi:type II secretory pathway component PulF